MLEVILTIGSIHNEKNKCLVIYRCHIDITN